MGSGCAVRHGLISRKSFASIQSSVHLDALLVNARTRELEVAFSGCVAGRSLLCGRTRSDLKMSAEREFVCEVKVAWTRRIARLPPPL